MIRDRVQFPGLLAKLNLNGVGVEVGTYSGTFAAEILKAWPGILHCVDPWCHQPGWQDLLNENQAAFEEIYKEAVKRLQPFTEEGRCVIHRQTSVQGAKGAWAKGLDFVYIDADHRYEHADQDIKAWWPTVKSGGLLCGHDYRDGFDGHTLFGVKQAVDEFMVREAIAFGDLWITTESNYPSWFVRKP
jgi:Methyltransferase domain